MSRIRGFRSAPLATVLICLVLTACAEETSGPQFANDPVPTRLPTLVASPASPAALPAATPLVFATPLSVRDLLDVRGAVSTVFVASRSSIWAVQSSGEARRLFETEPGTAIQAIDSSPGAEAVVALLRSAGADSRMNVAFIGASDGAVARIVGLDSPATPVPGGGSDEIDWSPQGDRVLVGLADGTILQIPVAGDGQPERVDLKAAGHGVVAPAWSPTGEAIAFIETADGGRDRSLRILNLNYGTVSDVVSPPAGRFVVEFAWMPDGVSLLFTEGGEPGGAVSGIDLWQVDASGAQRRLVASAGSVAPVARISNIRPSRDGKSVAYAVLVPGASAPRVDSVWVRDIASGTGFKIPLPQVRSVDDIWWTDKGLVLSVTTGDPGMGRPALKALLQVTTDGGVEALWAAPVAGATPTSRAPGATPTAG